MATATAEQPAEISLDECLPNGWMSPEAIAAHTDIPAATIKRALRTGNLSEYRGEIHSHLQLRVDGFGNVRHWIITEGVQWRPTEVAIRLHRASQRQAEDKARRREAERAKEAEKAAEPKQMTAEEMQTAIVSLDRRLKAAEKRLGRAS